MKKAKEWFINNILKINSERYFIIAAICGGMVISGMWGMKTYSESIQSGIANRVVRFHVIADSDEKEAQELKLKVRDSVLQYMAPILEKSKSKEETEIILGKELANIKNIAAETVAKNGFSCSTKAVLQKDIFPIKDYGGMVFPAGEYDSVRIELGSGNGQNWWCVMFPPLCFVDADCEKTTIENKEKLKRVLTEEEYEIVVLSQEDNIVPEVKFKIVEWWQEKNTDASQYVTKP